MATQYDAATGTFHDDGINDTPPAGYTDPLKASLSGTQPPPAGDMGYTKPLQQALSVPQLPPLDVDKIAGDVSRGGPSNGLTTKHLIAGRLPGMTEAGNIDLTNRPDVPNADGSHSSVRSMSFEENGREVLVPTVSEDGRIMTDDEAIAQYRRTGRNLGKFDSPASATRYAQALHEQQAAASGAGAGTPNATQPLTTGGVKVATLPPGAATGAPATATHHTVLSPESQAAITQLDTATAAEGAAERALGETRASKAEAVATGDQRRLIADQEHQDRIQKRLDAAQNDYAARVKEYDQQYAALKGMHETDFYADKSTGYRIAAAISVALGAVSQAFGGKNVGAELIGKEIEAHAARQRNNIIAQRELTEKAHVGTEGAKAEADRQTLLWETAAYDRAAHEVQARASQYGGQEERQKAALAAAQLEAKGAEKKALLLKMTGEQVVTDTGRQTEADRLALEAAKAKGKAKAKGAGGGDAGDHSLALQDLMGGIDPSVVQRDYKLSDKSLKLLLANAKNAPAAGQGANNPLAIFNGDGSFAGLAGSARNRDQIQQRMINYDDAIKSLKELQASGKVIPVGSAAYHRAVLAIAAVTTANSSDKTTEHEAGTIKSFGLLDQDAIASTLSHVQERRSAYTHQLRPGATQATGATPAQSAYAAAAQRAKDANGAAAAPTAAPSLPAGAVPATKGGRKGITLNGQFYPQL